MLCRCARWPPARATLAARANPHNPEAETSSCRLCGLTRESIWHWGECEGLKPIFETLRVFDEGQRWDDLKLNLFGINEMKGRVPDGTSAVQWDTVKPVHDIIVNPATVKKEKGKLLRSLAFVFGHSEQSADLLDDASGCGLSLVEALTSLAKLSTTADKAVVLSTFNRIKSEGIPGEVLLPSLKSYLIKYKRAKGDLEPSLRASLASPRWRRWR